MTLSLALANTGDLQGRIVHQDDDTPSIFTEFLAANGRVHQLAWWPDDFGVHHASRPGRRVAGVVVGGEDSGVPYAHFEPPGGQATIIEITKLTDAFAGMAKLVRDAADGWDGTDPIRPSADNFPHVAVGLVLAVVKVHACTQAVAKLH